MITAWSTPGAALLTSALADYPYAEAIGAFVVAGVLMAVVGATGLFGRILDRIPPAIVAATLAGILFPFALAAFAALSAAPEIVAPVLVAFVLAKRILARTPFFSRCLPVSRPRASQDSLTSRACDWRSPSRCSKSRLGR